MAKLQIDLDRDILYEVSVDRRPPGGVVCRRDRETGADVFMYRTDPGVYYSANGIEVSPALAARAGFDIEKLSKEREKRLKVKAFEADWNAKMNVAVKRTVETRGQFRLVDLGDNRYIIEDFEGNNVTVGKQANTEQAGLDWLEFFAGPAILPEDKKEAVDGNISGSGGQSVGGTDRRPEQDGGSNPVIRKPSNKKAPVQA